MLQALLVISTFCGQVYGTATHSSSSKLMCVQQLINCSTSKLKLFNFEERVKECMLTFTEKNQ